MSTFADAMQKAYIERSTGRSIRCRIRAGRRRRVYRSVYRAAGLLLTATTTSSNFFNSVRSRQPVVEDATFGFRAAGAALLSNLSVQK